MANMTKKEYLELSRKLEVKNTYCKHCTSCNACYEEGKRYEEENKECKQGLKFADSKQLRKDLYKAHNYIPGNIHLFY